MVEVRLPQAGMGMTDGEVTTWHCGIGDRVSAGQVLVEVEAAKTTVEVEAPAAGVVTKILAEPGDSVLVGQLMAVIDSSADAAVDSSAGTAVDSSAGTAAASEHVPAAAQITPPARKLARQLGIDWTKVRGTGPGGRVIGSDIQAAAESAALAAKPTASRAAEPAAAAIPYAAASTGAGYQTVPLTGVRRRIADRVHTSLRESAQFTISTSVEVTDLVRAHRKLRETAATTYTDYVVRACSLSLREHPRLNATLEGTEIRIHPRIDIGLAVDVGDILIVPVIRGVDRLPLPDLAARRAEVTARARAGSLTPDEVSGATFTVSNLGAYGVDSFTPVLNLPEVAILGVGRVARAVIAREGGLALGYLLSLSLTVDHRAVDGAPAARFLQAIADRLHAPEQIVT